MKSPLILTIALALLSACGTRSAHDDDRGDRTVSADEGLAAFDKAPPTQVPGLDAAYAIGGSTEAAFVAFYSDARYFAGGIKQITAQRFQLMGIVGRYEMNGTLVVPHAVKTSCPRPRGNGTIKRLSSPDELVIDDSLHTYVLPRLAVSDNTPQNGYVLEWGCFDEDMNFTPHAWEAVQH